MNKDMERAEWICAVAQGRLKDELVKVEKQRQDVLRELEEYEALLVTIRMIKSNTAEKINIRTSLGHQVFVNAELENRDTIIVKLGGDYFAELRLSRAEIFVAKVVEMLNKKADLYLEMTGKIHAQMQIIMANLGDQLFPT